MLDRSDTYSEHDMYMAHDCVIIPHKVNEVTDDLMKKLHSQRNSNQIVKNLQNELNRWTVEGKGL